MTMTRLTEAQRAQFETDGWVMVPDIFTPSDLEPLRREIAQIVDDAARQLQAEGKLADTHADEGFETRLTRLLHDHPEHTDTFMKAIEGRAGGGHTGREMFNILTHPKLLERIETLTGPEIVASSVYRIRPKVPHLGRGIVPWHQDSGYFEPHCDQSLIVTCWIPLVDATPENGCLQVLPRAHRQGVVTHKTGGNAGFLVIDGDDLPTGGIVTVPVPLGGALLLTNLTPHQSLPNTTDVVRWSVDLRYQSRDVPTNAFEMPEAIDPARGDVSVACYAPEGDFVVRSQTSPELISDYDTFVARRTAYDAARHLPPPSRGWQPLAAASIP